MKPVRLAAVNCLIALAAPATAYGQDIHSLYPLYGQALKEAYLGQTVDGIYKAPRERSGTNQFTESFYIDGTSYYREGDFTQEGLWDIRDNRAVCFSYPNENPGVEHCFAVFESGNCQYAYAVNNVRNGKPINSNSWTAKTLIRGDVTSCDNLVG